MKPTPSRWSPLARSTLALGLIASTLIFAWGLHLNLTGIGIPRQDPTPEWLEHERFHEQFSKPLFVAVALSILLTLLLGAAWLLGLAARFGLGLLRPRAEGPAS